MNIVVLRRRLFYICAMVVLLVPLYFLGHPSIRFQDGSVDREGGTLAQLRTKYNLGQGDLGEIDPASESMRLATLGLRGVAATILWQKAEYYKKEQYWDRLSATLNQIAVLQPHFIKVWEFQSHNLSYNVSSEFDNYRHRYEWVKRGIDYLVKGSKYNRNRSEMPYEIGWVFGNKFGVSDERRQFRELYKNDENFHDEMFKKTALDLTQQKGVGPDRKPDNWLGGRLWYERAYEMVEGGDARPARSEMMFYRMGPQWLMKHAEGIQTDGVLDEAARYAWRTAGLEWGEFGERQIITSFGDTIFLTELARANEEYTQAKEEFIEFCGDAYHKLLQQRMDSLSPIQRAAWEKDYVDRSFQELLDAEAAGAILDVNPEDVARETPENIRVEALQMAKNLAARRDKIHHIEIYRNQINYAYWEQRCIAEQEDAALAARINMFEADDLLEKGELDAALEKYEIAWDSWEALFNKHPAMMIDDAADEVLDAIERYRRLLDESDLPEDFGLSKFMKFREVFDDSMADPGMMSVIASWPQKYPGRSFLDEMLSKSQEAIDVLPVEEMVDSLESTEAAIEVQRPAEGRAPSPVPAEPQAKPPTTTQTTGDEDAPEAEAGEGSSVDERTVAAPDSGRPPAPGKDR